MNPSSPNLSLYSSVPIQASHGHSHWVKKNDMKIPSCKHLHKDADQGFLHVHAWPRKQIFVDLLIRGAVLTDDYGSEHHDKRFVVNTRQ